MTATTTETPITTTSRSTADMLARFYKELQDGDFTDDQAFDLVRTAAGFLLNTDGELRVKFPVAEET